MADTAAPVRTARSAPAGPAVVALCRARTRVETHLCEEWAAGTGTPTGAAGMRLAWSPEEAVEVAGPDDLIMPVGVVWSGGERDGELGGRIGLVAGEMSDRVRELMQARTRSRHPERCRVVAGEPATLGELRARWTERSGRPASGADFGAFVGRQADISLEREARRYRGDRYRAPRAVIDEVVTSPGFADGVAALAEKLGRHPDVVMADVREYLEEMASEQSPVAVDLWARWARYLYSGAYRLDVDRAGLERVQQLGAEHPLVFLPSHRSNLDPYVMASLLYEHGLPQNHTLGGINMAFWPIGPIGRRVGVVFIRRSFRDNEVYRFVLQRYLAFLVGKRFNLEWYIEGTRSRTGKLLPPRLGLLNYLMDALDGLDRDDLYAVPTAIVYDLLPEARDMTAESRGVVKEGEGLGWLVRYARQQRGDMGAVHVRFGEPLKLAEALKAFGAPAGTGTTGTGNPATGTTGTPPDRLARSKVAFEICVRINRATVMTAPALLLFALLGVEDRALTLAEVGQVVAPVLEYAEARAIPIDGAARSLATEAGVEQTLGFLTRNGMVECFAAGVEPVYRIRPDQQLVSAFYRNSILHWFVNRALVELLVIWAEEAEPGEKLMMAGQEEAMKLRDLLKHEFFFPEKREFEQELAVELALIREDWQRGAAEGFPQVREDLVGSGMLVAHRTLRCFIEAYSVVADRLVGAGADPVDSDAVLAGCLELGRQYRLQRRVTSEEAVSAHLFRTGLRLAEQRGLFAGGEDAITARRAFSEEIQQVLWRLQQIHDLDRFWAAESRERAVPGRPRPEATPR